MLVMALKWLLLVPVGLVVLEVLEVQHQHCLNRVHLEVLEVLASLIL